MTDSPVPPPGPTPGGTADDSPPGPAGDLTPEQAAGTPDALDVPVLLDPEDAGLPVPDRQRHGGMPEVDDDELALTVQRERVAAGLADYVPDDVPPATDPLPEGSSEAADLAQRGIEDGAAVHLDER